MPLAENYLGYCSGDSLFGVRPFRKSEWKGEDVIN